MSSIDEIVVVSGTALPLVRESVNPRKTNKNKEIRHKQHRQYNGDTCSTTKQFQCPRSGRQVHWKGVHPQIRLLLHQVHKQKHIPTSVNNKTKIGFACKLV